MSEQVTQSAQIEPETGLLGDLTEQDFAKKEEASEEQAFDVRESETVEEVKQGQYERPEGITDDLWDNETGTFKSDKLYEEYKREKEKALGLRQKLAKGAPKPPESPEGYKLNTDRVAERLNVEIDQEDPGFQFFKEVAHKNGLDQETFENVYLDYMEKAIEHNKNIKPQEFTEEDQKEYVASEMKKLGDNAPQIVQSIKNWNKQLFNEGILSEEDLKAAHNMGRNANEIRVINAYRQAAGNITIPERVGIIDGQESEAEIQSIMSRPEYNSDPALQKKVEDFYKRKYG